MLRGFICYRVPLELAIVGAGAHLISINMDIVNRVDGLVTLQKFSKVRTKCLLYGKLSRWKGQLEIIQLCIVWYYF